jgi:hypothetical protein
MQSIQVANLKADFSMVPNHNMQEKKPRVFGQLKKGKIKIYDNFDDKIEAINDMFMVSKSGLKK